MTNFNNLLLSATNIKYLLAIWHLENGDKGVRCVDVANFLHVTKASVHTMAATLKTMALIRQTRYGTIHLTEEGQNLTNRYHGYFKTICAYFVQILHNSADVQRIAYTLLTELSVGSIQVMCRNMKQDDQCSEGDPVRQKLYSGSQVGLAKQVCAYLTKHMNRRVTIPQLAAQFNISQTQLKSVFREVYGVSVYAYIRTQKMQAAAQLLRQTDCTVLEIAGRFGYENGSKFAKAFRDVNGMSPRQYRSAHQVPF